MLPAGDEGASTGHDKHTKLSREKDVCMSPSLAPGAGARIFPSSVPRYWFSGQIHHFGQEASMEFRLHRLARRAASAGTVEQWREHVLFTYPSVAQRYSRPARYLQRKTNVSLKELWITMVCVYLNPMSDVHLRDYLVIFRFNFRFQPAAMSFRVGCCIAGKFPRALQALQGLDILQFFG